MEHLAYFLNRVLGLFLVSALLVVGLLSTGPLGGWTSNGYNPEYSGPVNVPTFQEFAKDFPQCSPGTHLGDLLVVDINRKAAVMDFDTAVEKTKIEASYWVVGSCP